MKKNMYQESGNGVEGGAIATAEPVSVEELQRRVHAAEFNLAKNKQALMDAVDAVIQIDAHKRITFFNKAAESMFGYAAQEVIGQNVKVIVPIEHRGNHDQYVDNNVQTGVNKVVGIGRDLEASHKNGTKFHINLSLSRSEAAGQVEYTAFIKDISDLKRIEREQQQAMEEMKAQEEELRQNMEELTATQEEMSRKQLEIEAQMAAINSTSAYVEFSPEGQILGANELFLRTTKYDLKEIEGKTHKIFWEMTPTTNREYDRFWDNLRAGKAQVGEFKRMAKDGDAIWMMATYTPVFDKTGKVVKVIKLATDITDQKLKAIDYQGQLDAIGRSNAVIEFQMDGTILSANDNFLRTLGYSLSEIKGKHHRMFVTPEYARSAEYREFWDTLNRGEFFVGTYTRINKYGEEVFIQASYNPIKDLEGKPYKVVKYALDMTEVIRVIKAMAKGDLSMRCDTRVDNGGLTGEINKTLDTLNGVLGNISQGSDVVSKSSDLLQKKTEDMKRNTAEVATAIAQMAKGAQDQASRTDESSKLISHVMTSANDMEKKANFINKAAEKGLESSNQGMKTVKVLVNNMNGIKESAGLTSQSITVLTKRTEEIGRTLNVITDIASQTNLLALNAAIEAARAGDAGRGFAVVAEEIRKLAEDSRKSAVEIEKIISDVQNDTQSAGKAIDTMEYSVKEGNKSSVEAESIFQEIARSSEETFNASKDIQVATLAQKDSIGLVVKNIEQIVVVSEETAAGTQQVASSSQQMSGGMVEIAKAGDELSAVAAELQAGLQ